MSEKSSLPACCQVPEKRVAFIHRVAQAGLALMAVVLVATLIVKPALQFVPGLQVGTSFIALFGFGIVASLSTCLASTGAFLLAYTATGRTYNQIALVHIGRVAAFVLGGALLGWLGGGLPSNGVLTGAIALILGVGFLGVGLHLLDLSPSLSSLGLRFPSGLRSMADRVQASRNPFTPLIVGAVTFVLPCGFTQTAQALALASQSPWTGALMMGAFSIGTLPALMGITLFGSGKLMKTRPLRLAAGAILFLFSLGQIDGALIVFGSPYTLGGLAYRTVAVVGSSLSVSAAKAEEQVINMTVAYGTFRPNRIVIKRGVPVRWLVDGQDISGCADSIIAPSIGISRRLQLGLNVINFTPVRAGEIPFSCSMGMIRGSFIVTN